MTKNKDKTEELPDTILGFPVVYVDSVPFGDIVLADFDYYRHCWIKKTLEHIGEDRFKTDDPDVITELLKESEEEGHGQ